jgi:hypothetical protein
LALLYLPANRHEHFSAAHGNAPSGCGASCHRQLSSGAIEVPFRSHRAVFSIWFDKKIPLDRTGATKEQSEHIFDYHYSVAKLGCTGSRIEYPVKKQSKILSPLRL